MTRIESLALIRRFHDKHPMTELLTAAQMRAIETAAIESGEVTGLELMERAGRGVVEAIFEQWPELKMRGAGPSRSPGYLRPDEGSRRVVVLCGPGNNGGDGFVVARLMKEHGWEVEVFLFGDAAKLPPDARVNYEQWRVLGAVQPYNDDAFSVDLGEDAGKVVVVDALFGTGLIRPVVGFSAFAKFVQRCRSSEVDDGASSAEKNVKFVAIDVPSGLDADSGYYLMAEGGTEEERIQSDLTVSFHRLKLGHVLGRGALSCGKAVVADIGLDETLSARAAAKEFGAEMVQTAQPGMLSKDMAGNKFSNGHALVVSGARGHSGAARLAARAALRVGAGLVTVATPRGALPENAAQLTAIMLREVDDARELGKTLSDGRINALCLGPGMGLTEDKAAMVGAALRAMRATVLDADALTLISRHPTLFAALHEHCVLTPHAGEFARLFPDIAERLNAVPTKGPAYSKVDATREAAARAGCVVLFKGPDTVIAGPDGLCRVSSANYERAAPWLATAGSGDVLAGLITGLMARGFAPGQAAETGAWLHLECALEFGPGLIAEDLPEMLPEVFRSLDI